MTTTQTATPTETKPRYDLPEFFILQNTVAGGYYQSCYYYDNADGPTTFASREDAQKYADFIEGHNPTLAVVRFSSSQGTPQLTEGELPEPRRGAEFFVVQNTGIGYDGNGDGDRSYARYNGSPLTWPRWGNAHEFATALNENTRPGKYAVVRFSS